MLYRWIRLLFSDNGVFTDKSIDNQDDQATTSMVMDPSDDYIYLGHQYPVNNFFLQIDTANTTVSSIEIQYWTGQSNKWVDAVDILDATAVAGAPVGRSGVVQFSPDDNYNWDDVSDTNDNNAPTELSTLRIYNTYWLRYRFSTQLSAGTAIKRLAYAFTSSQQLSNLDTQIDKFLDSFQSGKTNWDDEIVTSSMYVVEDLKRKGLVINRGQVLRFDDVTLATDLKTLILIYANLGPAYRVKKIDAELEYTNIFSGNKRFSFDTNSDAFLQKGEITNRVGRLQR